MDFDSKEYLMGSDFHLRLENLELSKIVLETAYKICKARQVPMIIAGDIFHTKAVIRSECLNLLLEYLRKPDWKVIMIVGNHDFENVNCEGHSLEAFRGIPSVMVIDQFEYLCSGKVFLSSYCPEPVFQERIKGIKAEYLVCHHGIAGFKMNNAKKNDQSNVEEKDFKGFKKVFCGHWHYPQQSGNIIYIGSPYQQNFGESGQVKRFMLFNVENNTTEDIMLNEFFPQYHIIKREAEKILGGKDTIIPVKDCDHVRFDISGDKESCNRITKGVIKDTYGIDCDVRINPKYEDVQEQATIEDSLDYTKMFERWLSFQKTPLDKKMILNRATELINASI